MFQDLSTEELKADWAMYEYLYTAFYKVPDEKFLEVSKNFISIVTPIALESGTAEMKQCSELLNTFASRVDKDTVQDMNASFTKLFVSAHRVNDRESRRRENIISINETILSVSSFFADSNVVKPVNINMPVDSFSMELFYMFKTAEKAVSDNSAREASLQKRREFLNKHLSKWHKGYLDEIYDACSESNGDIFYKGLSLFCKYFIDSEVAE